MTPLQTSTGVLPGADRHGRPERRVLRADWDRRPSGRRPPDPQRTNKRSDKSTVAACAPSNRPATTHQPGIMGLDTQISC